MEDDQINLIQVQFNPPTGFVNLVKYSSNGRYYATITDNTNLMIFDGYSNEAKVTFASRQNQNQYKDVAFTSDGNIMATAIADQIIIYKVPTLRNINNLEIPSMRYPGQNARFIRLCFGSNDLHIAAATADMIIYIITQFRRELPLAYHLFDINSINFTSLQYFKYNSSILSTGSGWSENCSIWNSLTTVGTRFPEKQCIVHPFTRITHSVISPDGRYILLTHLINFLTSWEVQSENIYQSNPATDKIIIYNIYTGHESANENLMGNLWYTGRNKLVLAGSNHGRVFIWNFEDGRLLTQINTNRINDIIRPENIEIHIEPQADGNVYNMVIHEDPQSHGIIRPEIIEIDIEPQHDGNVPYNMVIHTKPQSHGVIRPENIEIPIEPQPDDDIPNNMIIHIEPQPHGNKVFLLDDNGMLTLWRKEF